MGNKSKAKQNKKLTDLLLDAPSHALNPILQAIAIIWMLFVAYKYYFPHHPEYFGTEGLPAAFSLSSSIFGFLAIVGVAYLGWVLYNAFNDKEGNSLNLTPFAVLGIFSAFLLVFADYWFLTQPSFKEASFMTANISLVSKLSTVYLTLFTLTLYSFAFGKKILNLCKFENDEKNKLGDSMLSIGLGLGVVMLIVFLLGIVKQFTATNVVIAFALLSIIIYKELLLFLKRFFLEKFTFEARYFSFEILFLISLGIILAMNVLDLIRPMPIGWDDMGVYLNYPKQMAGNQALLPASTNNYFLIASLPFSFFKNQYLGAMNGMFISFWGGVLMLFGLGAFVKKVFNAKYGLMIASLIYIIPMTMHQSYADMKTDMTLFFFMIMSAYCFFVWFQAEDIKEKKWLILSGVLAGIAFGIKPTAIFLIFGVLIGVFYRLWKWKGALGIFLLEWILLISQNRTELTKDIPDSTMLIIIGVLAFFALGLFYFANTQKNNFKQIIIGLMIFVCGAGFAFSPWILKNLHENSYKLSVSRILNGHDANKPRLDLRAMGVDQRECKGTAQTEELGRYLGYEDNLFERYLTLPWKVTMNTTVHGFYLDLSFLFLAFVPFGVVLFFLRKKGFDKKVQKTWQALMLMGGASWFMWIFVGSGVIWYGIFGFVLILPLTAYFFYENKTLSLKITAGTLVFLSILSGIAIRGTKFANHATIQYAYGITSGLETVDIIVPNYRQISCIVTGGAWNKDSRICKKGITQETSPIYRIGTFIAYFIPDNNHRLLSDPQLDKFKCIDDAFKNNELIVMRKLKEAGVKYFILDLNTATIEKDPNGSLHQKSIRFVEWVNKLNSDQKMFVHVYNKKKGIAFMEITDEEPKTN